MRKAVVLFVLGLIWGGALLAPPLRGAPLIGYTEHDENLDEETLKTEKILRERLDKKIMKWGYPGTANVFYREGYVVSYNGQTKLANWVCEKVTKSDLEGQAEKLSKSGFQEDRQIPLIFRAKLRDYKDDIHNSTVPGSKEMSLFTKYRLANPKLHLANAKEYEATFLLSNVCPMFATDSGKGPKALQAWKELENNVVRWVKASGTEALYVVTGPLYVPATWESVLSTRLLGASRIHIPTHFYKVILREKGEVTPKSDQKTFREMVDVIAFAIPNSNKAMRDKNLSTWITSVDEIEFYSGLDFFHRLPTSVESGFEGEEHVNLWK